MSPLTGLRLAFAGIKFAIDIGRGLSEEDAQERVRGMRVISKRPEIDAADAKLMAEARRKAADRAHSDE